MQKLWSKIYRSRTLKPLEIALAKICLISLGLILGISYRAQVADLLVVWWLLFLTTAVYFTIKFFREK